MKHASVPAITDNLLCDFFVQTLNETLKEDMFSRLDGQHWINFVYTTLLSLSNNRVSAAAAKMASVARVLLAMPPAVSAPHVQRTQNSQPGLFGSGSGRLPTPTPMRHIAGMWQHSTLKVPNTAKWKGGLFECQNGIYQFKVPCKGCFCCWTTNGHRYMECALTETEGQVACSEALAEGRI